MTGEQGNVSRAGRVDVSVVLATFNRAAVLEQTLAHFRDLDTSGLTWQVLAVDNGSTDDTQRVLAAAARGLPLLPLHQPERGKNRALNLALPQAAGELVVFTDDDIIPDRGWLREMVRAAGAWPDEDIFAGQITPRFPAGTPEWVQVHPFGDAAFARFQLSQPEGPTDALAFGPNFAVRGAVAARQTFSEGIGPLAGVNYAMGSETDYLLRLQHAGHRTVYVPAARVEHLVDLKQTSPDWLLGRSYRLGRGLTRLGLSHPPRPSRILKTWLRYRLSPLLGTRRHFDIALEYQFLRGSLHEKRLMASETRPA